MLNIQEIAPELGPDQYRNLPIHTQKGSAFILREPH